MNADEPREIKSPTDPPELSDLSGKLLLALDPIAIGGGCKSCDPFLPERRRGVSVEQFPQGVELQHARRTMGQLTNHRNLW